MRVVAAFVAYGNQADIDNTAAVYAALRDGSPLALLTPFLLADAGGTIAALTGYAGLAARRG